MESTLTQHEDQSHRHNIQIMNSLEKVETWPSYIIFIIPTEALLPSKEKFEVNQDRLTPLFGRCCFMDWDFSRHPGTLLSQSLAKKWQQITAISPLNDNGNMARIWKEEKLFASSWKTPADPDPHRGWEMHQQQLEQGTEDKILYVVTSLWFYLFDFSLICLPGSYFSQFGR